MIRLFVALDLGDNTKKDLEKFAKGLNINQARVIQAQNMHITVKFIGYVEEDMLDSIDKSITKVAKSHKPFNLVLDKLGAFPSNKKGRIFWIGSGINKKANDLSQDLDSSLKKLRFKAEKRSLKIHLTLARIKKEIDLSKYTEQEIKPIKQQIDYLTLYESHLSSKGAQYKGIKRYLLKDT